MHHKIGTPRAQSAIPLTSHSIMLNWKRLGLGRNEKLSKDGFVSKETACEQKTISSLCVSAASSFS